MLRSTSGCCNISHEASSSTDAVNHFHLSRIRKALENKSNMEDDRVAILEAQLAQAKLIAEEADKKYEEVRTEAGGALNT